MFFCCPWTVTSPSFQATRFMILLKLWSFLGCACFAGMKKPRPDEVCVIKSIVSEKIRNWNQLETYLIAPGLEYYFQSRLRVEIILATLMINLSLWAQWCLLTFMYYLGALSVRLEVVCLHAESGKKYSVYFSSTDMQKTNSSAYLSPKLLLLRRVGQNQLVSRDQAVEVGSKQGRGEDKGELEDAFGQISVALYSVGLRNTAGFFCAAKLWSGNLYD